MALYLSMMIKHRSRPAEEKLCCPFLGGEQILLLLLPHHHHHLFGTGGRRTLHNEWLVGWSTTRSSFGDNFFFFFPYSQGSIRSYPAFQTRDYDVTFWFACIWWGPKFPKSPPLLLVLLSGDRWAFLLVWVRQVILGWF